MNTRVIVVLLAALICITMAAPAMAQPSPFVITGHVSDSDGNPCNGAWVRVTNTNTNTSVSWDAENDSASNYYKLVLDSDNVSAGNVLQFEASSCTETKMVEHTVTQSELEDGGMIDFDIVFDATQEIIWQGDVTLINGTTFDKTAHNSGVSYEINRTTALGALGAADEEGVFNYTVNDEWYGLYGSLFVDSIADIPNEGYNGWMYWVNHPEDPMPMVGADQFVLENGDVVTWYWSSSMEMTPADSPMLVSINVTVISPDLIVTDITTPSRLRNEVINPISAVVENTGTFAAGSFNVTLSADGLTVDTASVAALGAGNNTTVEFLWTPDTTGNATLTVTADADGDVVESDETNNDLSEIVNVLDTLTATVNVRIEGMNDTVWCGDVTFSSSVLVATDGSIHYLNEPTALGALDCANESGGFGYVLEHHPVYGLYVSEINSEPPIGWDGWMYRVNYVSPWVGAGEYTLYGGEDVLWYFGAWTAPPLKIELDKTTVMTGETFVATVTAYNDSTAAFDSVEAAEVYVDGALYGPIGSDGTLTMSLTAGSYQIHADKGTWANYTRSEKVDMTVTPPITTTYDFTTGAGLDRWAYRYQTDAKPAANDVPDIEFMSNTNPKKDQYVKISTDNRKMQSDSTDLEGYYAAHRFVFDVAQPVEDILTIEVLWNGKGAHTDKKKSGATLYIRNGAGYEELASTTSNKEVYLSAELTGGFGNYIDANGYLTVLVEQNSAQTVKGKKEYVSTLSTDYVKVDITHT